MGKDFAEIAHNVTSGATKWLIDVCRARGTAILEDNDRVRPKDDKAIIKT